MYQADQAYKEQCREILLGNHSVPRTALEVAQKLMRLEKLIPKHVIHDSGERINILVNYDRIKELSAVNVDGVYSIEIDEDYDEEARLVYYKLELSTIMQVLEDIRIYSIEYIPLIGAFNIKTVPFIEHTIENYTMQLVDRINTADGGKLSTQTCLDYVHQFAHWWNGAKASGFRTLARPQAMKIISGMIPIAVSMEDTDTVISDIIQKCVKHTVLQEHFHVTTSEKKTRTGLSYMTIIYWVSFKNALEFLGTTDYRKLSPIAILETLLANFGYANSPLCQKGEKEYSMVIDDYGIERFTRLDNVEYTNTLPPQELELTTLEDMEGLLDDLTDDLEDADGLLDGILD